MGGTPDGPKSTGSSVSPGEGATFVRPVEPGTEDLHVVTPDLGPDLPPLRPGELLAGRFSIERFIARGGMGAVYEATDLALRSRVALKIIRSSILGDGAALERFRREVLLARKIAHRNVCHVYEFYETRTEADLPVHFLTMELLEGETLASRLHARGRMTPGEALPLVLQMCDGLAAAHDEGVVHRDFKSGNVMLVPAAEASSTGSTRVVITDFGIARPVQFGNGSGDPGITGAAGMIGTPEYMAPEQVTGSAVSPATDIYSLGIVMYEMVTGALPFVGDTPLVAAARRIHETPRAPHTVLPGLDRRWSEVILHCLAREPERRFHHARDVSKALVASTGRPARKAFLAGGVAVLLIAVAAVAGWRLGVFGHRHDESWLRTEIIPEIHRLADADHPFQAHLLAMEANAALPGNPLLVSVWKAFAGRVPISSTPPGARVLWREYADTQGPWHELGRTPLKDAWFPRDGFYRVRLELEGYRPYEAATVYWWLLENAPFPLDPVGTIPEELVHIPATTGPSPAEADPLQFPDFFLERTEVTNRRYKAFVDAGGYRRREFWPSFERDGTPVAWEQGVASLVDRTGRPGPSTWELSNYPRGEDELPVGGISWYEAAAFANYEKRALPTTHHWFRAAGVLGARWMVATSNLEGKGPVPVGRSGAINRFGALDMAGNVREWCFNEQVGGDRGRFILGGGWNDPTYAFVAPYVQSPWDRSATNGVRLAVYAPSDPTLKKAREPIARPFRDFRKEKPASDAEMKIYLRMYSYDRTPLDSRLERTKSTGEWTRETVSFDAAYGHERMIAHLFVPRGAAPPFQPVIYFPGSGTTFEDSIDQEFESWDFLVRGGRMLVFPVFRGTLERRKELNVDALDTSSMAYRDAVIQWARDLGRTIDYLETRKDVDLSRIGYFGWSWGGQLGGLMPAVEPRIKVAVLNVAGLDFAQTAPEVDPFNFLNRIKIPVLMLNGKLDRFFPVETSQIPMFEGFGTPPENKRRVSYEAGHLVPRSELIKETLNWFDRYLGPVGPAGPPAPK